MRSVQSIEKTRIASNGERFCWTTCTNFLRSVERREKMKGIWFCFLASLLLCIGATAAQQSGSWKAVDDAMGRQGQDQPDGAHRFAMPRSDLKVTVNGVEVKPGFALGSWAAFQMMGNH